MAVIFNYRKKHGYSYLWNACAGLQQPAVHTHTDIYTMNISQRYPKRQMKTTLYVTAGSITLALGIIGIFLPLLPTTPFLLLSAWFYCRSSSRLYGWLAGHPVLGLYIRNYTYRKATTLSSKITAIVLLWITLLLCIFVFADTLWLKILLGAILIGVTWHLLSLRTLRPDEFVTLHRVRTNKQTARVAALADTIWREHYGYFIDASQLDYMLAGMQSAAAIKTQTDNGYDYYLLRCDGKYVGYTALRCDPDSIFLSKLYLLREARGKGFAAEVMTFAENRCRRHGKVKIRLTVNRANTGSIAAYHRMGFVTVREEVADIGNGYVMDDYIMEKNVAARPNATAQARKG